MSQDTHARRTSQAKREYEIARAVMDRVYAATSATVSTTLPCDIALIVSLTLDQVGEVGRRAIVPLGEAR